MKLEYKSVEKDVLSSIFIKRNIEPFIEGNWHFHKELELIYFLKGRGVRIVGDHLSYFQEGELVLVGEWLPHLWRNDKTLSKEADFIVLKFHKEIHGVNLFGLPELAGIREMLQRAGQGVLFSASMANRIHEPLLELSESRSADIVINFLRVLNTLASAEKYELLASPNFSQRTHFSGEYRLQRVIHYITENYSRHISLEEIAGIAFMTPPAFCRFFKNRTNKTFSHFLNEFRITKACQLLISGEIPIKQICYEVGFSSPTNFNRAFRNFNNTTPTSYREGYRAIRQ